MTHKHNTYNHYYLNGAERKIWITDAGYIHGYLRDSYGHVYHDKMQEVSFKRHYKIPQEQTINWTEAINNYGTTYAECLFAALGI